MDNLLFLDVCVAKPRLKNFYFCVEIEKVTISPVIKGLMMAGGLLISSHLYLARTPEEVNILQTRQLKHNQRDIRNRFQVFLPP